MDYSEMTTNQRKESDGTGVIFFVMLLAVIGFVIGLAMSQVFQSADIRSKPMMDYLENTVWVAVRNYDDPGVRSILITAMLPAAASGVIGGIVGVMFADRQSK